jgi:lipid II:glycine glycyltransferase (peptidoglycan interpeptide bridge formation enzyme)
MAPRGPAAPGKYLRGLVPAELTCCDRAASFLQSGFWGSFKARFGWAARGFLAEWEGAEEGQPLLVMRRPLGPGFSFAYVPWGPELPGAFPPGNDSRNQALTELAGSLRRLLPGDTAFVRFDPPWYDAEGAPLGAAKPFTRAGADVQPPDTVLLDLSLSEPELLGGMKPKWRYNIKLAEKKGVSVIRADEEGLETFYALYRETAQRDGIAIHSADYYRTLFSHYREYHAGGRDTPGLTPEPRLYLAEHEGEALAGIITLFRGDEAMYLYGASADHKRNLMAPYALQWRAVRDARAAGCRSYDLFGIPPREDPAHPMAGLYRFKTGFGGRIVHRPGSWDYTYRPLPAGLFRTAEGLRKSWRNRVKRRS